MKRPDDKQHKGRRGLIWLIILVSVLLLGRDTMSIAILIKVAGLQFQRFHPLKSWQGVWQHVGTRAGEGAESSTSIDGRKRDTGTGLGF